ncbi:hypothetical protein V5F77_08420 [Xanthobacter sp. DSM 24535]|uniref:hypothetical protein n=1 Tax=Roseixanthobacter psychrophilus TaxID=3119917 RepID=UPI0037290161
MHMRKLLAVGVMALLPTLSFAADPILTVAFVVKTTVAAKVSAVDAKTRMITLIGAEGNWLALKAGDEMQNFPQIKVGDTVVAGMEQATEIQIVHPNDGTPVPTDVKTLDTAPAGTRPAAVVTDRREIAATVTAVALDSRSVTLKGPAGNSVSIQIPEGKDEFKKIKVGDHVIFRQVTVAGIVDIAGK